MSRLFVRLFFVVVLTLFIASWSLDVIFEQYVDEPVDRTKQLLQESLRMFAHGFTQKAGADLDADLERLQSEFSAPVTLEPMELWALPEQDQKVLQQGGVIELQTEKGRMILMGLVDSGNRVLSLGPLPEHLHHQLLEYFLLAMFFVILGFALLLWIWPHWRNLEKLSAASFAFGQGELNARANLSDNSAIAALAKTFNSMADRIQTLIQSHKHLTSAVAHELRTPISRIRFSLEMLTNADEKDIHRHVSYMQQDVDELDKLIAEMMTYARLERGTPPMKVQSLQIVPWMDQVLDRIKTEELTKTLAFRYEEKYENLSVKCYAPYLERAILNLVNNALRYAEQNIMVEFLCENKRCIIHVDDDGPGVPEDKREEVLLPFTRLESSQSGKSVNFGLGLSIVDQIAKWHDGRIEISESPMHGARFSIIWPCQAEVLDKKDDSQEGQDKTKDASVAI